MGTPQEQLDSDLRDIGHEVGGRFAADLRAGGGRTTEIIAAQQQLSAEGFAAWLGGFGRGISDQADPIISSGAPEPGPGWHFTTCGWCGGEASHEDNCKNDT